MKDSNKEQIYNDLKQKVLSLDLQPGSALDEQALSQEYGLSRTPLREIFQRLAGDGYISLASHRGASVSSMDMTTMRNFFQSAPMIYAAIARLAAEQATARQIHSLKSVQQQFRTAVVAKKSADMVMHNHRFHELIGDMAASPYLQPSLCRLLIDHTRMGHRFYSLERKTAQKRIAQSCDQHDAMIEAIEQREAAVAVQLTLEHWELSRTEIDKYVLPDSLPLFDGVEEEAAT